MRVTHTLALLLQGKERVVEMAIPTGRKVAKGFLRAARERSFQCPSPAILSDFQSPVQGMKEKRQETWKRLSNKVITEREKEIKLRKSKKREKRGKKEKKREKERKKGGGKQVF